MSNAMPECSVCDWVDHLARAMRRRRRRRRTRRMGGEGEGRLADRMACRR